MSLPGFPNQNQDIMVIAQNLAPGQAFPASAHRDDPLTLKFMGAVPKLSEGNELVLLYAVDGTHHKLACIVRTVAVRGDATYVGVQTLTHENLDRRRSHRYPVDLSANIAFVQGTGDVVEIKRSEVRVTDLSRHGAWVEYGSPVEPGSLFNLTLSIPGYPPVRALTLCARTKQGGFGLNFVDFVGTSRQALDAHLKTLTGRAA
jgi:hypothetical protein